RNPFDAFGRALDAGEHEMNDIFSEVVLTRGYENLGPGDFVAAVRLRYGAGAGEAEIRAALRLGEGHRAGPFAADELGQIQRLLFGRAMDDESRCRALRQPGIHGEGYVRRYQKLPDGLREHAGQPLPAEFGGRRCADPAAFGQPLVGVLETRRRGDGAVRM